MYRRIAKDMDMIKNALYNARDDDKQDTLSGDEYERREIPENDSELLSVFWKSLSAKSPRQICFRHGVIRRQTKEEENSPLGGIGAIPEGGRLKMK